MTVTHRTGSSATADDDRAELERLRRVVGVARGEHNGRQPSLLGEGEPVEARHLENVSQEAWKMWGEYCKMVLNEYRLNPASPKDQEVLVKHLEEFFFGEGAALPPGYVPPKTKA